MSRMGTLPQVTIEADGSPLAPDAGRTLASVRVQGRLSLPTLCELTFTDPPGPLSAVAGLRAGTALRVGVAGKATPLFTGEITAVEYVYGPAHEREIRVRGYDLLHRLRKRQAVRAHVQVTTEALARDFAGDLGLAVEAAAPGPLWERLIQHRQSDLDLLVSVAERAGLYLAVRETTLHLLTLDGIGQAIELKLGDSLLEARIEANGDPACRMVTAEGWDPLRVEKHSGRATEARVGRAVALAVEPVQLGGSGERTLLDAPTPDDSHATGLAQAELDRSVAREVTFWGVADGDPALRPGAIVLVTGVADVVAGGYVLTSVTHTIDPRLGFVSELSSMPPPPGQGADPGRPQGSSATLGVVTQVGDPDTLGRIRVTLPAFGDVETDWMGVLSVGAGKDKGLVALPDVGDQVLVLLAHADPSQGVVLGGLYGTGGPPDAGVDGGSIQRYTFQTRGGQRIRLDDVHHTIRLENDQGSYVELAPGKVQLHAATNLEIAAPGHSIVIKGQTIDFEKG